MRGRRTLLLGAAAALGGCGFRPMYLPAANGTSAGKQLASIYVAVMAERSGQLLRQALQRRFDGAGGASGTRVYELTGSLGIATDNLGTQRDNSTTRVRMNGSAPWVLRKLDATRTVVTQGTARALDGENVFVNQFFAQDLETEAVTQRIAEACADQITQQLASFLRRQAAPAA